jgi:hypothetical protein
VTWTYDVSDLATSALDQVRFTLGDTLASDPQMQDEEINYVLTQRSSVLGAAALCCRSLATKYARSADEKAGDTQVWYSQIAKGYALRAIELEAQAAQSGVSVVPFAGGTSVTDANNRAGNADLMPSQFNIGMMDSTLPVPSVGNETGQDTLPDTQQR